MEVTRRGVGPVSDRCNVVIAEPPRHLARALAAIDKADAALARPRADGVAWEGRGDEPKPEVKPSGYVPKIGDIPLANFAAIVRDFVDERCDLLARENSRLALRISALESLLPDRNAQ